MLVLYVQYLSLVGYCFYHIPGSKKWSGHQKHTASLFILNRNRSLIVIDL